MRLNRLSRAPVLIVGGAVGLLVLIPVARRLFRSLSQSQPAESGDKVLTRYGFEMDSGVRKAQMGTPAQKPTKTTDQ